MYEELSVILDGVLHSVERDNADGCAYLFAVRGNDCRGRFHAWARIIAVRILTWREQDVLDAGENGERRLVRGGLHLIEERRHASDDIRVRGGGSQNRWSEDILVDVTNVVRRVG